MVSAALDRVLELLGRCGPVKQHGREWRCVCPAHDDTTPSLDVRAGADGRVLFQCRSKNCASAAIAAALGLTLRDLFPDDTSAARTSFEDRVVAAYSYRDEAGRELYQAVRLWAPPPRNKDFRQRRRADGGKWEWNLNGTRRVPYRLPELLAADPAQVVFIAEGEKDVDNLIRCGQVATTNPMGAGKWPKEFATHFQGRHVVILPDNDEAGEDHARKVLASLAGVAASVKVVRLPDLPSKGDFTDWMCEVLAGQASEVEDLATVGDELLRYCESYVETAAQPGAAEPPPPATPTSTLPLLYFSEIAPAIDAADFIEGLLIDGGMSVVYGESGCGKTFFTLDLSLHAAFGMPWRGRAVDRRGVLYLALEGSHGICNRVAAFKAANHLDDGDFPFAVVPVALDLLNPAADTPRVIDAAKVAAARMRVPVGLIVVDTLSRAIAGGNENSPDDMGALVRNIDRIRQALPAHVCVIHHSGKDTAKGARGHSLLRAATDTEIEVSRDVVSGTSTARVTKQREMDCDGEFAFRLESIALGVNRRGKTVTSCVVREAETVTRDTSLAKDEQSALSILFDLITECGAVGFPGVPDGTASVIEALWRQRFYERCKPGEKNDTRKRAYRRAVDGLIAAGRVAAISERVWICRRDKSGQIGICPVPS